MSVPGAFVLHPWWDGGKIQTKRLFRYGMGTADIMRLPHIKPYTFVDFTNTVETVLLLITVMVISLFFDMSSVVVFTIISVVVISEIITNCIKSIKLSGKVSLPLAYQMFLHKNAYEAGMVWSNLKNGRVYSLGRRLDLGFKKVHPAHFRFNKWKIIKLLIIFSLLALLFFARY